MLQINVITIFPDLVSNFIRYGILNRAIKNGKLQVNIINLRDFTSDNYKSVDDYPYGGGAGMVLKIEPIVKALANIYEKKEEEIWKNPPSNLIYFTPSGEKLTSELLKNYARKRKITLLCGRYEDVDYRVRKKLVTQEISIGDYVLSGGELAAAVFIDGLARFLKGTVGNEASVENDSFEKGLLDYPHYTRPPEYLGEKVPEVLLSGNHKEIEKFREKESLLLTYKRRRDLIDYTHLTPYQKKLYLKLYKKEKKRLDNLNYYVALIHHPVYDREKRIITTSVTNMDIHDICRSSATFGAKKYFVTNPVESQRNLVGRIIYFWTQGFGSTFHKNRNAALEKIEVLPGLEDAISRIKELEGMDPLLIATSAKYPQDERKFLDFKTCRKIICQNRPVLLLFGTGWGLTREIIKKCDYQLEPIVGVDEFNHLSVRSAVAVILDRLTKRNYTD